MSLHRAIVIDVTDPQGLGRVSVEVPAVSADPVWAHALIPLGILDVQLPEIGAGVWVAFEGDDFSSPVLLGSIRPTP